MKNQSYSSRITTSLSPQETLERISNVSQWWAKNFEGDTKSVGDVFTVRFKNGDRYKMKVAEITPNKKIVWDVIDADQTWHNDRDEWVGTKIIWEIVSQNNKTEVKMTHVGLVPEFECFEECNQGWDYLIKQSLQNLFDNDKGVPV